MKKMYWIFVAVAVVIVIGVFVAIKVNSGQNKTDGNIILESSYINYAWGFQYNGTVICDNGNMYSFKKMDRKEYENVCENLNDLQNYILSGDAEFVNKVTNQDLKQMKTYMESINDAEYTEVASGGNDMGAQIIYLWKQDKNERILLRETGDWNRENTNENTKALIELVEKYIKKD